MNGNNGENTLSVSPGKNKVTKDASTCESWNTTTGGATSPTM